MHKIKKVRPTRRLNDSMMMGFPIVKWMTVYTPYGYGEVDMLKFQRELEENAQKNDEVHKLVAEYIREKELQLKLDIDKKENEEKKDKDS